MFDVWLSNPDLVLHLSQVKAAGITKIDPRDRAGMGIPIDTKAMGGPRRLERGLKSWMERRLSPFRM